MRREFGQQIPLDEVRCNLLKLEQGSIGVRRLNVLNRALLGSGVGIFPWKEAACFGTRLLRRNMRWTLGLVHKGDIRRIHSGALESYK